jgi:hypothetical protein
VAERVARAIARSIELASAEPAEARGPSEGARAQRVFAIGDPQTTRERFFRVLDANGLLDDSGMLAPDAALVSIGDHFDFGAGDPKGIGDEGFAILAWLSAHSSDRVVIVAGNHDLSRVVELAMESDASFAAARALAERIQIGDRAGEDVSLLKAEFAQDFPAIPTPQIAQRDYMSFTVAQRRLVARLLVTGRMRLAHCARLPSGESILLTHAGVTDRELTILDLEGDTPADAIAARLNEYLARAIAAVEEPWERGERVRLDLEPLHVGGVRGREGGGFLYHRPANPERADANRGWEFEPRAPRRFDPRALPRGLVQACGHSAHKKNLRELQGWLGASVTGDEGCLRTLSVEGERVTYEARVDPPRAGAATLYLIDAEMNATDPRRYRLFDLAPPG